MATILFSFDPKFQDWSISFLTCRCRYINYFLKSVYCRLPCPAATGAAWIHFSHCCNASLSITFRHVTESVGVLHDSKRIIQGCINPRARGSAVGWGTALKAGRSRVRFSMVSLEFFIDIILPAALWPWGRLSLYQKWVPGMFPAGKGGRCVGLTTLPPSCADCLEMWEPQPPGTLRACPGL